MAATLQQLRKRVFTLLLMATLISLPLIAVGQPHAKKRLQITDYHLWNTLQDINMSSKGSWVSYSVSLGKGTDSLYIKNTNSGKLFTKKGSAGVFSGDELFMYQDSLQSYHLLNLNTGTTTTIPGAVRAEFSGDEKNIVMIERAEDAQDHLVISNTLGKKLCDIKGVNDFSWNHDRTTIAYTHSTSESASVSILNLKGKLEPINIIGPSKSRFTKFAWGSDGKRLAFYSEDQNEADNSLYFYDIVKKRLFAISSHDDNFTAKQMVINDGWGKRLLVSDDGQKVFFAIRNLKKHEEVGNKNVEIWNGNDKMLFPERQAMGRSGYVYELAAWWPESGKVTQVTDPDRPFVMLVGNQDFALTGSTGNYDPQYRFDNEMDLFITNLKLDTTQLFLKQQPVSQSQLMTSPDLMTVFYYKDANWWSYSVTTATHTCITSGFQIAWDRSEIDPGNQLSVYGLAGFTTSGEVLIYDAFDIWSITLDGSKAKRITNGREQNIQYRLFHKDQYSMPYNYSGYSLKKIDLSAILWLKTLDLNSGAAQYATLEPRGIVLKTFGSVAAGELRLASKSKAYAFIDQRFDLPPRVTFVDEAEQQEIIYQSNKHHFKYEWGSSELIKYTNSKGDKLNAALFYPVNYDASKSYPMIVYIYDTVSRDVFSYVNPTLSNNYGFNVSHLTQSGYFVLMPDIRYERGNTGFSAVDCVEAAIKQAAAHVSINNKAIGLFGHSFGGFETNFIISHTNVFAAAVSGSAVSDVVSAYLTVHPGVLSADAWRYEKQQYRLGSTLYSDMEMYLRNSPVHNAETINTSLLLFAGKEDDNVRHEQSIEFYLALRRLKKKTIMLLYPGEGHIQFKEDTRIDLTVRVEEWFNHFLKKEKAEDWIADGTN